MEGTHANNQQLLARLTGSQVCDDLDTALICAEVSIAVYDRYSVFCAYINANFLQMIASHSSLRIV
jgi:hypothetical protein